MIDIRVENIFIEEMEGDTSFQEKDSGLSILFGKTRYSKQEMRETWDRGIKLGIEIGLNRASLEGQKLELSQNTTEKRHKEFLEKIYNLAEDYQCAIQYHPKLGMVVIDRKH